MVTTKVEDIKVEICSRAITEKLQGQT